MPGVVFQSLRQGWGLASSAKMHRSASPLKQKVGGGPVSPVGKMEGAQVQTPRPSGEVQVGSVFGPSDQLVMLSFFPSEPPAGEARAALRIFYQDPTK